MANEKKTGNTAFWGILGAGLTGLGIYAMVRLQNVEKGAETFVYNIKSIKLQKGNWLNILLNGLVFEIKIEIINPTNSNLRFKELIADMYLNQEKITRILIQQPVTIPKHGQVELNSIVKIPLTGVTSGVQALIRNVIEQGSGSDSIYLKGYIEVSGIRLPINESIKLDVM